MYKPMLILSLIIFLSGCSKEWTLMVCESPHFSGGCAEILYELKGYENQRSCMEKGIELNTSAGFECGSSCKLFIKDDPNSIKVCDEICNEKGCS